MNLLELSEQELNRRQSLEELRKMGINPYPAAEYPVNAYSEEIRNNFDDNAAPRTVCIAGRLMSRRVMGKASFAELQDSKGRIQVYITRDDIWILATLSASRATSFAPKRARSASTPKSLRSSPRAFGRYRL